MDSDTTLPIKFALLALLVLSLSLAGIMLMWQLLRLWRRHDRRHGAHSKARKPLPDAWQAAGHRLEKKIDSLTDNDRRDT